MGYKDILVLVDTTPQTRGRIEIAAALAERFGAHLVALFVAGAPDMPHRAGYFEPALLEQLYDNAEHRAAERAQPTKALFDEAAARHGLVGEWRFAVGDPTELACTHGRYADLIVAGQIDPDDADAPFLRPFPEEVVLGTGRPTLIVPYAGTFGALGRRVLVGWDARREATRAVSDALPLLAAAEHVTVLTIDPKHGPDAHGEVPGADIALHLARHGVTAQIESTESAGIGAGNVLLSRASDLEADLLVIGAYGHSRMREVLLGGATRTVLEGMTLPVLMAH